MLLKVKENIFNLLNCHLDSQVYKSNLKKQKAFREYQLFNEKFQNAIFIVSFNIYFSSYVVNPSL